ncbi:uncharacterized protein TNCV_3382141 [Trichonephila clavipes]|nr:uncharacterized protein TNCV_3382141 [Trichonephila clavipes]
MICSKPTSDGLEQEQKSSVHKGSSWNGGQDNDPCYTAGILPNNSKSTTKTILLSWSAQSLDLNPIENLWEVATRGLLATDHVIFNHGQVTWTTPELAPPSPNYLRENVSALDRFNVHRCPTRRVFSGTGLELVTRQATVRYLYHSATAAPHLTATRGLLVTKLNIEPWSSDEL